MFSNAAAGNCSVALLCFVLLLKQKWKVIDSGVAILCGIIVE